MIIASIRAQEEKKKHLRYCELMGKYLAMLNRKWPRKDRKVGECKDCKWWEFKRAETIEDKSLEIGYCHRFPPPNFPVPQPKADVDDFAFVAEGYWCGEFQPKL